MIDDSIHKMLLKCCDHLGRDADPYSQLARVCIQQAMAILDGHTKATVYGLRETGTETIQYIGQTTRSLKVRLNAHLYDPKNTPKAVWVRSVEGRVEAVELERDGIHGLSERYHILRFKERGQSLLNRSAGGGGVLGYKHSEETREKISLARRGKPLSEYHRMRVSEGQRGKKVSDEARVNLSKSAKGRLMAEETKRKLSLINKGRKVNMPEHAREASRQRMIALNKNHPQWRGDK